MSFKDQIPKCFGEDDIDFGSHYFDQERAIDMIKQAFIEYATWNDVQKAIEDFLASKGADNDFIKEQVKKAKDIESYLH